MHLDMYAVKLTMPGIKKPPAGGLITSIGNIQHVASGYITIYDDWVDTDACHTKC
jgi:hypothetical protein